MNAARPPFALPFSGASISSGISSSAANPASDAAAAASGPDRQTASRKRAGKVPKGAKRRQSTAGTSGADSSTDEYAECLRQARICREQAQEAARLKRFSAAHGLFQTAIALCQRALGRAKPAAPNLEAEPNAASSSEGEAREYIQVLVVEMGAYDELARSMNRPLRDSSR